MKIQKASSKKDYNSSIMDDLRAQKNLILNFQAIQLFLCHYAR